MESVGVTGFICSIRLEIGKKKKKQHLTHFFLKEKHLRFHSLARSYPWAETSWSWGLVVGPFVPQHSFLDASHARFHHLSGSEGI